MVTSRLQFPWRSQNVFCTIKHNASSAHSSPVPTIHSQGQSQGHHPPERLSATCHNIIATQTWCAERSGSFFFLINFPRYTGLLASAENNHKSFFVMGGSAKTWLLLMLFRISVNVRQHENKCSTFVSFSIQHNYCKGTLMVVPAYCLCSSLSV